MYARVEINIKKRIIIEATGTRTTLKARVVSLEDRGNAESSIKLSGRFDAKIAKRPSRLNRLVVIVNYILWHTTSGPVLRFLRSFERATSSRTIVYILRIVMFYARKSHAINNQGNFTVVL